MNARCFRSSNQDMTGPHIATSQRGSSSYRPVSGFHVARGRLGRQFSKHFDLDCWHCSWIMKSEVLPAFFCNGGAKIT